ncbi:hypothetical protein Cni_G11479 [Canna indica]|uniref:Uncharacterized protein n=1 Tax=Canna indica TaxID=4628 RepID=A0AAQ3QBS6_9LILI|nr:hypothetical protein Cni_G11479 [Canna indica]
MILSLGSGPHLDSSQRVFIAFSCSEGLLTASIRCFGVSDCHQKLLFLVGCGLRGAYSPGTGPRGGGLLRIKDVYFARELGNLMYTCSMLVHSRGRAGFVSFLAFI